MKYLGIVTIALIAWLQAAPGWAGCGCCGTTGGSRPEAPLRGANLCHNGGMDNESNPLDGWMIDYAWTGNSHYMHNKSRVSAMGSHAGKRGVMHINAKAGETKVESLPIPFDRDKKYRCTIDYMTTGTPHIYFVGYKWKPGIRPYHDKPIHLGDLRKIYKSSFRNHSVRNIGCGWKREVFEFPMDDLSKLAEKHLRDVRYITVYFVMINSAKGEAWIDNVMVQEVK